MRHLRPAVLLGRARGCSAAARIGDGAMSAAFVDPSRYDLYSCKQLDAERKSLATQIAATNKLIEKAETGAAGTVVAEIAYRNTYISQRAQERLANDAWTRYHCDSGGVSPATASGASAPSRSGSAVY